MNNQQDDRELPGELCKDVPGLVEALRQRIAEYPDYRAWLERFSPEMLAKVMEPPGNIRPCMG